MARNRMTAYQNVSLDVLGQRVSQLEVTINKISNDLSMFMQASNDRSLTQWPMVFAAISVGYMILGGVGWLAYTPINKATSDLGESVKEAKAAQADLKDFVIGGFISQREYTSLASRVKEERDRVALELQTLKMGMVTREEHSERWRSIDKQFENQQRQIDKIDQDLGATWTARDAIVSLQKQVEDLQSKVLKQ